MIHRKTRRVEMLQDQKFCWSNVTEQTGMCGSTTETLVFVSVDIRVCVLICFHLSVCLFICLSVCVCVCVTV